MKRYKFQALVRPLAEGGGGVALNSGSHRMVLRAENAETHRTQVFSALVDAEDSDPYQSGKPEIVVTLRVIGDDVADYLDIGSHFSLWHGSDIGEGVVTRRLHI
ncbi:MAG TPA: hypothetical protein VED20_03755 [Streptosporangiaceae bacterium]|nr:hypothetical protein [Streptosporangiaceae bacterium]